MRYTFPFEILREIYVQGRGRDLIFRIWPAWNILVNRHQVRLKSAQEGKGRDTSLIGSKTPY